ncbi:MAG: glutamate 5-kinase [Candidatus Omnitrophica bacterium]|nr:glutamate 5-kinase [Candidatus Omnitrophota bacterium]MDD5488393.1 glutamate 5-kinase [Candidatus Omnitrophota bacterium]
MKRITVKIGTRVLTDKDNRIDRKVLRLLVGQISDLVDGGLEVIVVSSGAIGAGLGLLNIQKKGRSLSDLQAIASVGQNHLMDIYNEYLAKRGYVAGQILLTQDDFNDRRRFLNIRYTINSLLEFKAVPIINENDTVSTEEIKFGDNDRLSSLVADISDSDMLVILTDVEGLMDASGCVIGEVDMVSEDIKKLCRGKGCEVSTGGMISKLESMAKVSKAGIPGVIARGRRENVLLDIRDGKHVGTRFNPSERPIKARKRWIAFSKRSKGAIVVDDGARKALVEKHKSLLPGGVKGVRGVFSDGDVVDIVDADGKVLARGVSNYTSAETDKIKGKRTDCIERELGYKDYDEVVHRDNLVVMGE